MSEGRLPALEEALRLSGPTEIYRQSELGRMGYTNALKGRTTLGQVAEEKGLCPTSHCPACHSSLGD